MTSRTRGVGSGLALAAALATGALAGLTRAQTDDGVPDAGALDGGVQGTMLDFHTMTPVSAPFVGSSNPIRGVNGGALPWVIGHGDGTLRADGEVEVSVSGLVLANDPAVPQAQRGTNPNPTFAVIVSCMTTDASGAPQQMNVTTPPAPATTAGDAHVQAKLALPTPCLAPVLFVAGPNGAWFAVTGSPTQTGASAGGTPDAGTPDAGTPDAGTADAGM